MTTAAIQHLREERHTMVGGSDLHHVFSLPPYGCARQLVMLKRPDQFTPDHTFHGNRFTERGTQLEDMAARLFSEQTGLTVRQVAGGLQGKAKRLQDYPYIGVHADREIVSVEPGTIFDALGNCVNPHGGPGILSVKVPGEFAFKKIKREGLPHAYLLQLQYELYVWNRQWGTYALLWADGWELRYFHVKRDDELIKQILDGVHHIWGLVENGPLPDKLEAKDPRCGSCPYRTQCQGEELLKLAADSKASEGEDIPFLADLEMVRMVEERAEAKQMQEEAEALVEKATAAIKEALAAAGYSAVDVDGFRLYNRFQDGRQSVQREPLLKYLRDVSNNADALVDVLEQYEAHAGDNEDFNQLKSSLLIVLQSVADMASIAEKKFVTKGKPFQTLRVYPR